jgi:hypothetical protein
MKHLERILSVAILVTLFAWATGCGKSQRKAQQDLLAIEVTEQEKIVSELRGISDSLINNRVRIEDDLSYIRELSAMPDDELKKLEESLRPPKGSGFMNKIGGGFKKIGRGIKKLWPF